MPTYLKYIFIICAASLLFFPFLGHVHLFDWDEINFAECAREMIVSKEYLRAQIDFMPFWEKPPFFIWMQVLSMKLIGVGEFAARFPDALAGVLTLVALFYAGRKIVNERAAIWWVLIYAATWLPHFYFHSGIIDPTFNLFIFLAMLQVHFLRGSQNQLLRLILAGFFLGLAVLTKGPVALLIAALTLIVYLIVNKGLNGYKVIHLIAIGLISLIPVALWLGLAVLHYGAAYGKWFLSEFLIYQVRLFSTEDADHGGPFYYHFIVLLIGCFPASVFLFQYSRKKISAAASITDFNKWMWILFWVVLILFSVVKTKIVHYSSLCYFPLTYLAAIQISRLAENPGSIKKWIRPVLVVLGSIIALLITMLPLVGIFKDKLIPVIDDPFVRGNLRAGVTWSYSECLWGIAYLTGIIMAAVIMKKEFRRGLILLCCIQILIIEVALVHFTPKIEEFSQGAAIDFYKGLAGKDVYIHSLGFKSYATLFYSEKLPSLNPAYQGIRLENKGRDQQPEANEKWLLSGAIDKPAYFICKIQDSAKYALMPQLEQTGSNNGFVFFRRK